MAADDSIDINADTEPDELSQSGSDHLSRTSSSLGVSRNVAKSRGWAWTLHPIDSAQADSWSADGPEQPIPFPGGVQYCIFQVERAPNTGQVHLQGYSYYKNAVSFERAKRDISPRVHIEPARGSPRQNIDYCTKSLTKIRGPWLTGEPPQQGRRNDWEGVKNLIKAGAKDIEIYEQYSHLAPQVRGIEKLKEVFTTYPTRRNLIVYVLYGETGTGKTYRARTKWPTAFMVRGAFSAGKTFDGYAGQTALILDEWVDKEWPVTVMNSLLDEWVSQMICRYHNCWTLWERVIITSNMDPIEAYAGEGRIKDAFYRRITQSIHVLNKEQDIELV